MKARTKKLNKAGLFIHTLCTYAVVHTLFSGGFSIAGLINLFSAIKGVFL